MHFRFVEIPAYIAAIPIINKFGRRSALCGSVLASGIACLTIGLIPEGWRYTILLCKRLFPWNPPFLNPWDLVE